MLVNVLGKHVSKINCRSCVFNESLFASNKKVEVTNYISKLLYAYSDKKVEVTNYISKLLYAYSDKKVEVTNYISKLLYAYSEHKKFLLTNQRST